jgi:hypothetical protein
MTIASSSIESTVDFVSFGPVGRSATEALLPLRDGLLVDPVVLRQNPQALLTMLYRSTDRLCRSGAAVKNLAHSASLHANEKTAPSKPGIKHLGASFARKVMKLASIMSAGPPISAGVTRKPSEPTVNGYRLVAIADLRILTKSA